MSRSHDVHWCIRSQMEGFVVGLFRGVGLRLVLLVPTVYVLGGRRVGFVVLFVRVVVRGKFVDAWVMFCRLIGDNCLSLDSVAWVGGLVGCRIRFLVRMGIGMASCVMWS